MKLVVLLEFDFVTSKSPRKSSRKLCVYEYSLPASYSRKSDMSMNLLHGHVRSPPNLKVVSHGGRSVLTRACVRVAICNALLFNFRLVYNFHGNDSQFGGWGRQKKQYLFRHGMYDIYVLFRKQTFCWFNCLPKVEDGDISVDEKEW